MSSSGANLIHYELSGQGSQTLLLINGLARSGLHWLGFPELLVQMGYRVMIVDNRGFGRSSHLSVSLRASVKDFATDVHRILEKENISEVHLIGLSLGGMIALELAGQIPDQIRSVVAVNSSAAWTYPLRLSPKGFLSLSAMSLRRQVSARTKLEISALTTLTRKDARYTGVLEALVDIEKRFPVKPVNVASQLAAALSFQLAPIKTRLNMPILILYSSRDTFVPIENSFKLQQILPHAILRCIEGKGHELMIDAPEQVASVIDEHLAVTR